MLAFADTRLHESFALFLLVVEAHTTVLVSFLSFTKVDYLAILGIPVPLIGLFVFKLALDEFHLRACVSDLVLAHRRVFHPDPHKEVPLLHKHFFVEVLLKAATHSGKIIICTLTQFGQALRAISIDDLRSLLVLLLLVIFFVTIFN